MTAALPAAARVYSTQSITLVMSFTAGDRIDMSERCSSDWFDARVRQSVVTEQFRIRLLVREAPNRGLGDLDSGDVCRTNRDGQVVHGD